ncbi:MAG: glucosaminidase domain-containing protein [Thermodesulfobacteriota bacterium]
MKELSLFRFLIYYFAMHKPLDLHPDNALQCSYSETIIFAQKIFRTSSVAIVTCLVLLSFIIPQRDTVSVAKVQNPTETLTVKANEVEPPDPSVPSYSPSSSMDLQQTLEKYGLWSIKNNSTIDPVLFTSFPDNLHTLSIADKKTTFLHTLLPVALYANQMVENERLRLFEILAMSGALPGDFSLKEIPAAWQKILSNKDKQWLLGLAKRYKAETIAQLKKRVRPVPVSLLLAQSALESSWGTSRFAREGNNLFGIRTWGEKGLVPGERETGSKFLVAQYDTILDSVNAYILTLNSHHLYVKFRTLRMESQDTEVLSGGLLFYSEKRKSYVTKVNRIIRYNRLKRFDTLHLARYGESMAPKVAVN